ncbi:hypothetical protein ACHAXH_003430 [Discostella pseudostelligera]
MSIWSGSVVSCVFAHIISTSRFVSSNPTKTTKHSHAPSCVTSQTSCLHPPLSFNRTTNPLIIYTISLPILQTKKHERVDKHKVPETKNIEEGSARRNIARKHDHDPNKKEKKQHGGAGGKGKWDDLDDGSSE